MNTTTLTFPYRSRRSGLPRREFVVDWSVSLSGHDGPWYPRSYAVVAPDVNQAEVVSRTCVRRLVELEQDGVFRLEQVREVEQVYSSESPYLVPTVRLCYQRGRGYFLRG